MMKGLSTLRSLARGASALAGLCLFAGVVMAEVPGPVDPDNAAPQRAAAVDMEIFVVLEAPPAVKTDLAAKSLAHGARVELVRERLAEIDAEQDVLLLALKSLGAREVARHRRLTNAIQVRMPVDQVAMAAELPGVLRVEPVGHHVLHVDSSVPFIGAPSVWGPSGLGLHGEGVRIGIVDTGIDYYHAGFGGTGNPNDWTNDDNTIIEPGSFPTARVVGGHDFVGNNYNSNSDDPSVYTPVPDPDPLDCEGHGSHVAGIAAGNGVLLNGTAYAGPWDATVNPDDFLVPPGVAPAADIYALKIFGCPGGAAGSTSTQMIVSALEWAADPNGDGDFSDRLDVLNLSLGGAFGGVHTVEATAVQHLAELGCIVVGSVGNNGNTFHVAGGVAMYPESIGVANIADDGIKDPFLTVTSPAAIAGEYESPEAGFGSRFPEEPALAGQLVAAEPLRACEPLTNASAINGKIALVQRGDCPFVVKVLNAQQAGAIAVVVVNNNTEPPFLMGGSDEAIVIPSVMISLADGNTISPYLAGGVQVSFPVRAQPELARQVTSSSSRGPTQMDYRLKPDLAAPGLRVDSVAMGTGTGASGLTGTSMSAPHVAGAAALLRQLHPDEPVFVTKTRLMNTAEGAEVGVHRSPESWSGAGSMRVDRAAGAEILAYNDDDPSQVSISWGYLELAEGAKVVRRVRVVNTTRGTRTLAATVVPGSVQGGTKISLSQETVVLGPLESAVVEVTLEVNPAALTRNYDAVTPPQAGLQRGSLYELSGSIVFAEGGAETRVPYYAALDAASRSATPTHLYLGKSSGEGKAVIPVSVPVQDPGAHPQPLVSAFMLAYEDWEGEFADPVLSSVDLIAVGVASNVGVLPNYTSGTLFFGVAMSGSWSTPTYLRVPVQIEVKAAGVAGSWILYNHSYGAVTNQGHTDSFVVVRWNPDSGQGFVDYYLNYFPPRSVGQFDTGHYNNGVMVFPIPVNTIGLSSSNPIVEYQVTTYNPVTWEIVNQTPFLEYDFRKRTVATTSSGIDSSPFQNTQGGSFGLQVDEALLAANPSLNKVLLLHHHNLPGERVQVMEISLDAQPNDREAWMIF